MHDACTHRYIQISVHLLYCKKSTCCRIITGRSAKSQLYLFIEEISSEFPLNRPTTLGAPSPSTLIQSSFTTTLVRNWHLIPFFTRRLFDVRAWQPAWRMDWGTFMKSVHEDVRECQVGWNINWRYGTLQTYRYQVKCSNSMKGKVWIQFMSMKK